MQECLTATNLRVISQKTLPGGDMPTQSLSSLTRTKIICTLTPARTNEAALLRLIDQGMDVIRLNFSHMNPRTPSRSWSWCTACGASRHSPALLLDTKGPEVRLYGYAQPVPLQKGDEIVIRSYAGPTSFPPYRRNR
jgi:pyruvate kinase